jgi:hypothetical protein
MLLHHSRALQKFHVFALLKSRQLSIPNPTLWYSITGASTEVSRPADQGVCVVGTKNAARSAEPCGVRDLIELKTR